MDYSSILILSQHAWVSNFTPDGAKALLESKDLSYVEIEVGHHPEKLNEMVSRSQRRTVPQIFFDDQHIGGSTDLVSYFLAQSGLEQAA